MVVTDLYPRHYAIHCTVTIVTVEPWMECGHSLNHQNGHEVFDKMTQKVTSYDIRSRSYSKVRVNMDRF